MTGGLSTVTPAQPGRFRSDWPATGDFDGDGHADLALTASGPTSQDQGGYAVLYGPFGRDGVPSRTRFHELKVANAPWYDVGWIAADRIRPGRRTGLILHRDGDGEQSEGVVMPEVPPRGSTVSDRVTRSPPATSTGTAAGTSRSATTGAATTNREARPPAPPGRSRSTTGARHGLRR
nr:hypothetical protein GCM10020093_101670 [Planobispora longispora]